MHKNKKNVRKEYQPLLKKSYTNEYFKNRNNNDTLRQKQFILDGIFLKSYKSHGIICDIGCSTGEFLKAIKWEGEKYGMEVNENAIQAAQNNGISFEKNIFTETAFFDVIFLRGTIQHLDEPFRMLKAAHLALKDDGIIVFLASPNSESLVYRLKLNLPFLDPKLNFFIPGVKSFTNALNNIGFNVIEVEKPYWTTPYRNLPSDLFLFFVEHIL